MSSLNEVQKGCVKSFRKQIRTFMDNNRLTDVQEDRLLELHNKLFDGHTFTLYTQEDQQTFRDVKKEASF